MKLVFLFGAGASFGCLDALPAVPPLGAGLFDQLAAFSPMWAALPEELSREFKRDDRPFEPGFERVREVNDTLTTPLLRHMALFFLRYRPGPGCLYRQFARRLRDSGHNATVATLNYDLLLDYAIAEVQGDVLDYSTENPGGTIPLLKVHGAPNLVPDIPLGMIAGMRFANNGAGNLGCSASYRSPREAAEYWRRDNSLAPAMALYAAGKKVLFSEQAVAPRQAEYRRAVEEADLTVVIGTSYIPEDHHVWDVIVDAAGRVVVIDPLPIRFEGLIGRRCGKETAVRDGRFADFLQQPSLID